MNLLNGFFRNKVQIPFTLLHGLMPGFVLWSLLNGHPKSTRFFTSFHERSVYLYIPRSQNIDTEVLPCPHPNEISYPHPILRPTWNLVVQAQFLVEYLPLLSKHCRAEFSSIHRESTTAKKAALSFT